MFFSSQPQFFRGSDGRIYEYRDPDAEGGFMVMMVSIFLGICYALYAAYIWLLQHYFVMLGFSFIGIMTWTGWVYHDYQQQRTYADIGKKVTALLIVFACLFLTTSGFSHAFKSARLKRELQGEWVSPTSGNTVKITGDAFVFESPSENIYIEGKTSMKYDFSGFIALTVGGKRYDGPKIPKNATPYQFVFNCRIVNDRLSFGGAEVFQRK